MFASRVSGEPEVLSIVALSPLLMVKVPVPSALVELMFKVEPAVAPLNVRPPLKLLLPESVSVPPPLLVSA